MHPPTPSELHSQDTFFTKITDSSHQAERVACTARGTPTSPVLLGLWGTTQQMHMQIFF